MNGAGAGVVLQGHEGDYQNGLTYHNGQWWTQAGWQKQVDEAGRKELEARTIAALKATSAKQPTTTGGVINYGDGTAGDGSGSGGSRGSGGSGGSGGGTGPDTRLSTIASSYDSNLGSPIPPPPVFKPTSPMGAADSSAADALTFARAKDKVGETTRASIDAIRNQMSTMGQLGGRGEMSQVGRAVNAGAGKLADTITQQAVGNVARQDAVADRNYAGERADNNTAYSGAISSRGQDLSAAESRRQSILALAGMRPGNLVY